MSSTIRSFTSVVTALRRNTEQFPWRRPSSFCSVRAILLHPAFLDRWCYHIFRLPQGGLLLCALSERHVSQVVSNLHLSTNTMVFCNFLGRAIPCTQINNSFLFFLLRTFYHFSTRGAIFFSVRICFIYPFTKNERTRIA